MYKLNENSIQRLSDNASIPQASGNRDYQQFLQDVKKEGISIVEGSDVVEPDYVALRTGVDGLPLLVNSLVCKQMVLGMLT